MADAPYIYLDDDELNKLREWRAEFSLDFDAESRWREKRRRWGDYYDGDQWTEEERKVLSDRGQPPLAMNMIKSRIDTLQGMFLQVPIMMRAQDRGLDDFDKAKYITEALRYIEDQNDFNEVERETITEQLISGRGWYHVHLDFDVDDVEIKIENVDTEDIVVDRYSKKADLSDCDRLYRTFWVDVEDLVKRFPRKETEIRNSVYTEGQFQQVMESHVRVKLGDQYKNTEGQSVMDPYDKIFVDSKRKRIRFVQMYYRDVYMREFAVHDELPDGRYEITNLDNGQVEQIKNRFPGVEIYTKRTHKLNSAIFINNAILEEKEDIRPHDPDGKYPYVQLIGYRERNSGKMPYGYVRQLVDPQDAYNKSRSIVVHKQNTATVIADEGAVEDVEHTRNEANRPDGYIEKQPGSDFQIDRNQVNNADIAMINFAIQEMQSSGIPAELMGQEDKGLSGTAIQLRQSSGLQPIRPLIANARKARKRVFKLVLEEMQRYWTSPKLVKITDDPNAENMVLNQVVVDPQTGEQVIIHDVRLGKYDIKIEEAPQTENMRSEQFDKLFNMLQNLIRMGVPVPLEPFIKLIQASDLPNKQDLAQSLLQEQQNQQQMLLLQQQTEGATPQ